MTEQEWLECADPEKMLKFLQGKASERKLRLFACACCRRVWQRMFDSRACKAVEVTERFVDGSACIDDLHAAYRAAEEVPNLAHGRKDSGHYAAAATAAPSWNSDHWPCLGSVVAQSRLAAAAFAELSGKNRRERKRQWSLGWRQEAVAQAALLRDVLGNPFHPVSIPPAVLAWNDGTIPRLAEAIYDERAFDRLPVLADALEEAGCTDTDILGHCRHPGPHVRGCWVVDRIFGKK